MKLPTTTIAEKVAMPPERVPLLERLTSTTYSGKASLPQQITCMHS